MTTAPDILATASSLVAGARHEQHGDVRANFTRIAGLWNAYLEPQREITPADVGHMMVLLKVARTQSGTINLDNHIDMAGYAALSGQLMETRR